MLSFSVPKTAKPPKYKLSMLSIMASQPPSPSAIPQKRKGLTDADRIVIWKRAREHPPSNQGELVTWFSQEHSQQLNQSQISRILSSKYDYLDTLDRKKDKERLQLQRSLARDWPELEGALFE